jgi:MFS family permease
MPRSFHFIIVVQFLSAMADNALLILAIARMGELAAPAWAVPLLKLCFTLCYVLLAPLVGPLADARPKGRVMVQANVLKTLAMVLLLCGGHPLLAMLVAGWGAALYAPAKYGLLCELLPPQLLVRANGYFEGSTVCAVILGTVAGGLLVSQPLRFTLLSEAWVRLTGLDTVLAPGMLCLLALYLLATALNLGVGDSGVRYGGQAQVPRALLRRFWSENRLLWRDELGGLSMAVTTLLWAIGATLQLVVLRWAAEALSLPLEQAAYLQGVSAVGAVAGAVLASSRVTLAGATRLLPLGVALGLAIPSLLYMRGIAGAALLLVVVGAGAGFFVVPMNALLQHRGHSLLTAGRSIAVQGFNENAGILAMMLLYAGATALNLPLAQLLWGFGALVTITMAVIWLSHRRGTAEAAMSCDLSQNLH